MEVHSPLFRFIARLLMGVLLVNPLLSSAADLAVDGSNTSITQAANGVPIVNIAAPNSSGLSHNKFTDYNVGQQGLILNNATAAFNETQLGGVILGNSNLAGRAAGLILNEVTGGNQSQLKGYTEVAGQSAHVVVANPHGITCDGCGFINTPRVTLSTGAPVIEAGQLKQFDVDGGQISIDGAGLNAANISQFDLITRSAKLNAAIYAQQLNVVTGRNEVDAATLAATAKTDDGRPRPGVSIDSSALGGMYAGAIRLVGTEAGVGVKLAGDMAASADDIQIDANGKLTVARVVSAGELRANAEQIEFTDKAHADGNVQVVSGGSVTVAKSLTSAADLSVKSASLSNHGTLGGAGSVQLHMPTLVNQGGLIFSGQDMALNVGNFTNQTGDIYSLGNLTITATEDIDNRSGSLESAGNLTLQAKRISNQRDVLKTRQEKYAARITELPCSAENGAGDCDGGKENQVWKILERDRLLVTEASRSSFITAGGNLSLMGESLLNHASSISAAGDLSIKVDTLQNTGIQPGEYETSRVFTSARTRDPEPLRTTANAFNALYWPQTLDPLSLEFALNNFVGRMEWERPEFRDTTAIKTDSETYSAIIQAGGKVEISTKNSFDSSVVRPTYGYVAGGSLTTTDLNGSAIATAVSHNPQLSPDLTQQPSLPGFDLPAGSDGLFHLNTDGTHHYLVETNPAFASLRGFISSDYLLNIIGYNQDLTQRRLGDGLYEQRLVQQAVIARTGKRFIDGLTSDEAQFKYLMDNAIASKAALNLVPGIALSSEQVAALTHDIVWMQEQEVAGQKVLVPVLYLAQAKDRLAPTGALIQGRDVALISGSTLSNGGTLRAANNLSVSAGNISNSGLVQADQTVSLLATDSIRNTQGGLIVGKDVSAISLTGDIVNEHSVTTHRSAKKGFERREDFVDSAAGIEARNNLTLSAGRDLINNGGNLSAGKDAKLSATRDLIITSQSETDSAAQRDRKGHSNREQTTQHGSSVQIGGNLSAEAGRDLAIVASTVKAKGDIQLSAENDLTIASAADQTSSDSYRKSGGKKVTAQESAVRQQSAVIEAGGDLNIEAGNNLIVSASQLKAANEAYLYAGDQLALLSAENSDHSLLDKKKKGSWGSKSAKRDEVTDVRNVGTTITTGGDLTLESGGDQLYRKATLDSGADLSLNSGGAITFEAVKDKHSESHEKSSSSWVWTSMDNKGKVDETLRQSQLTAKGEVLINAVEGLHIDVKQINQQTVSQSIDAMVQADPSMAWLKEVEARGDVDWRQVKELHDKWHDSHSGLGGPAMIVIIIIVTYFTAGAASGLVGTVAGAAPNTAFAAATAATATTGATAAGWANVAATAMLTSAASTATVSTINNKGNVGAALKDTFSADSLKNYLVAGVTAGLTAGFYNEWTNTTTAPAPALTEATNGAIANSGAVTVANSAGGLSSWQGVGQFAANQALQNTTSAVLNKVLGREGSLGDALQTSLVNAFTAYGFNLVGDVSKDVFADGSAPKIALHALMGGLAAEAAGGDFKTGAIAAGVNEAVVSRLSDFYGQMKKEDKDRLLLMNSQLIGVLATVAQDPYADTEKLQTGASIAAASTQYNYLNHQENQERWNAKKACDAGDSAACNSVDSLNLLDRQRDLALMSACSSSGTSATCSALKTEAFKAAQSLKQASWSPEAQQQYAEAMANPQLREYTIETELHSVYQATNPIIASDSKRLAKAIASFGSDFLPGYGDAKAFAEAQDPFDYVLASVGVIPGVGDATAKIVKEAKALFKEGKVAEAAELIEGLDKLPKAGGTAGSVGKVDDLAASGTSVRPSPQKSEVDVGANLGSGARPQVSYKDGQEVPYGTSGSVRPDWCVGNVCSVEVKNYNIEKNQQGLINNVSKQAIKRAENLPQGMQQQVVIDVRGQAVTVEQERKIIKGIVQKSSGVIKPDAIEFKRD